MEEPIPRAKRYRARRAKARYSRGFSWAHSGQFQQKRERRGRHHDSHWIFPGCISVQRKASLWIVLWSPKKSRKSAAKLMLALLSHNMWNATLPDGRKSQSSCSQDSGTSPEAGKYLGLFETDDPRDGFNSRSNWNSATPRLWPSSTIHKTTSFCFV